MNSLFCPDWGIHAWGHKAATSHFSIWRAKRAPLNKKRTTQLNHHETTTVIGDRDLPFRRAKRAALNKKRTIYLNRTGTTVVIEDRDQAFLKAGARSAFRSVRNERPNSITSETTTVMGDRDQPFFKSGAQSALR